MNVKRQTDTLPARLLLATDLSARCDRALDRAAQLAEEWRAELLAVNILDTAAAPDQALVWATGANDEYVQQIASQQLVHDLSGLDIHATMRTVRASDAAAAIRDTAAEADCNLVVTGVARNEAVGRFLLGSTVERLARTLPQPLLVVRNRVRAPYQRIVAATDFSDSSRHALQTVACFFPGRELILYHAHEISLSRLSSNPHVRISQDIEQGKCTDFLAASELPANVKVRPVIEHGALETTLTQYIRQHEIDLVVIGTHGRSGIMNVLLGSTAAKLLSWLPCDVLVFREPRSTT